MTQTLRKWRSVFGIFVQEGLAYRASGIIWVLTDLVNALTMPLVWAAVAGAGTVNGMSRGDFIAYYLGILFLSSFVTSHMMWELAWEIKEGFFTVYLVRPMSFYQFKFIQNFTWRLIRSLYTVPFLFILVWFYRGYLEGFVPYLGWELWTAIILGHLVSFTFVMMMSMLALYTQEAMAIFELYYFPMLFLSGYMFPISLLPEWAQKVSMFMPFHSTLGVPTEILVGRLNGGAAHEAMLGQVVWIVVCFVLSKIFWKRGLRHYTGVGM